jgi:DNA-binding MarR family transcriptional regulator
VPSTLGKAIKLASSPTGRKAIRRAVLIARSEEGRKLIQQAKRTAQATGRAATAPETKERLAAIRSRLLQRKP